MVTKRDGRVVPFDGDKIRQAVLKAFKEVDGEETPEATKKAAEIAKSIGENDGDMTVEEIQDAVEDKLMASKRKDVARCYVRYRYKRSIERERNSQFMKTIGEKLTASNVQNQNANIDEHSFGGRRGEADSELMRKYALDYLVSDLAKERHLNNEIYIHDLDSYAVGMHNCVDGSSWISVRHDDKVVTTTIDDFANSIGLTNGQIADLSVAGYQILSRDGWTKLNNIVKRDVKDNETVYRFKTRTGLPLIVTEDHRLPIIRNGEEFVEEARNIQIGDQLISSENVQLSSNDLREAFLDLSAYNDEGLDIRVFDVVLIRNYLRFKYGLVFNEYASRKFKFWANAQQKSIKLEDFLTLIDDYPMSYEILSRLKIGANSSGHKYPLLIAYSSSLAKLYAYIYSDGHVYEKEEGGLYQVSFANTNEDIIDDFIKCFESCFGRKLNKCYPSEEYAKTNSPCIRVHCGDRFIVRLFKKYAGGLMNGSGDLSIPDFIINGTKEIKYAYLSAAIDSDGSLSSRNINVSTCCKKYAEQLSLIINSLGYHSTIVKHDSAGTKYHFCNSSRTGTRNFDSYSVNVVRNDEMYDLYNHMSTIKYCDDYSYKAISHNFVESKIIDIKVIENQTNSVYDVETDSHWFIVNNYVSHNCLTIPFDKLLSSGFNTRQTDVRPAQSVNTAFQLVAVIFQIQSLQEFGGVSASHIDWSMVPYVRKSFYKHYKDGLKYIGGEDNISVDWSPEDYRIDDDHYKSNEKVYQYALDMTEKETYQAVQGMYHNLNTLQSRSGNQLPFSSINYGTCTLPEGRMVIKALLDCSIEGVGKLHKTPIFPCGIWQSGDGINRKLGDPNYDLFRLALKSTALRLYPNYANIDWSGNEGYDKNDPRTFFSTMGCRTANGFDMNGFGQLKDGRGNICPVTIILPTIAMEATGDIGNKDVEEFIENLDGMIHDAKQMLYERYQWICSQNPSSAKFMWENGTMEGYVPEEGIRSAMKHGTLAIGQLGLAECLRILIGVDQTTEEGMKLAKRIEGLYRQRCDEFKQEVHTDKDGYQYHLNYGVYYTPAENLCNTAMKKFKAKYGEIKDISDRKFFTNSVHCSVWEKMTPFDKIDIESQLTGYSSSGCITYTELSSTAKNNIDALETIVLYAMDHDIPYFALNVPNDTCMNCGYTDEISDVCPMCGGNNIQRLRRVTGYLTGNYTTAFNEGKQQEVEMRVKHI